MDKNLKKIVAAALFAALVCGATYLVIPVPMANGYAHLGDVMVVLGGFVLGPVYGALAAGIGSAFADLFMGFAVYIPATFVIKGLVAFIAALLMKNVFGRIKYAPISYGLSALFGEIVMILGYFLFETVLYTASGALGSVVGNITQAAVGVVGAAILAHPVKKLFDKTKM